MSIRPIRPPETTAPWLEDVLSDLVTAVDVGVVSASTAYAAGRRLIDGVVASLNGQPA